MIFLCNITCTHVFGNSSIGTDKSVMFFLLSFLGQRLQSNFPRMHAPIQQQQQQIRPPYATGPYGTNISFLFLLLSSFSSPSFFSLCRSLSFFPLSFSPLAFALSLFFPLSLSSPLFLSLPLSFPPFLSFSFLFISRSLSPFFYLHFYSLYLSLYLLIL